MSGGVCSTLVLMAHGSRDPAWRASVQLMIEALQQELGEDVVRLAYMEHTSPTLPEVVAAVARNGVRRVRVLPIFLAAQGHVERDVRPLVEHARAMFPQVDLEFLPPLGQLAAFRAMIRGIAIDSD